MYGDADFIFQHQLGASPNDFLLYCAAHLFTEEHHSFSLEKTIFHQGCNELVAEITLSLLVFCLPDLVAKPATRSGCCRLYFLCLCQANCQYGRLFQHWLNFTTSLILAVDRILSTALLSQKQRQCQAHVKMMANSPEVYYWTQ